VLTSRKALTSGTLKEVPDKSVFIEYLIKRLDENNRKYLPSEQLYSSLKDAVMNNSPNIPQACLTAHQPIEDETGILGEVFVCNQLDDAFAARISGETGLEYTLWIGDIPVATSFSAGIAELDDSEHHIVFQEGRKSHHTFKINGVPYYSAHLPLEEAGLSAEVALDVTEIINTRTQSVQTLIASILGVTLISSVMSVLLLSRINSGKTNIANEQMRMEK